MYYLTCGVLANLVTAVVDYNGDIPYIGASGAVAGVIGAYFLLFPGSRIRVLMPIWIIPLTFKMRAFWFALIWIAMEIPPALSILFFQTPIRIGHWAHLGGFFAAALIVFFLRPEAFQRFINGLPVA